MTSTPADPAPRPEWRLYRGTGQPIDGDLADILPPPPPWRLFAGGPVLPDPVDDPQEATRRLGTPRAVPPADAAQVNAVNAALYLRRPLLVTGRPGTGKSSLAYRIARELKLGRVLRWPVTSRTRLLSGLYDYDAIGRVQAAGARQAGASDLPPEADTHIGTFVRLGPLGTALLPHRKPRVLLIDELDKGDADLPNDLLSVFEEGEYLIPELARLASYEPDVTVFTADPDGRAEVHHGLVRCREFPVVIITSNGEREFPPAFLRRCLRLELPAPGVQDLVSMVSAHFPHERPPGVDNLVETFVARDRSEGGLAADQLLNAVHLATSGAYQHDDVWPQLRDSLWRRLSSE
ncbi:MoxR family ATPase [Amycolatopsis sp. Hca4]|uniref:AAA family ATPase n=1 Tax=unclassified Amycolatopsis TaxID=2618356 RepID=UPI0015918A7C|nr:MoxR family ATPase [Amycolatopsis sp. Hca4]QKV72440.1 AAA family ATPase [Amycolatopsis sp. Hca4]